MNIQSFLVSAQPMLTIPVSDKIRKGKAQV
jgi:hypothetical protein